MKLHPFDAKALLHSLRRLDKARRTAFAAAIATRLLCAYEFVAADAKLNNGQLPRDTVSACGPRWRATPKRPCGASVWLR